MTLRFSCGSISAPAVAGLLAAVAACAEAAAQTDCALSEAMPADYAALVQPALHEPRQMWPEVALNAGGQAVRASPTLATHGQLLLGHEFHFLYHLPVFMTDPDAHPHNFQVVLEVTFSDRAARDALVADQVETGDEGYYTAVPPAFAQTALFLDYPGHPPPRAFESVDVFRDHFERDGERIASSPMAIEALVHGREFAPDLPRPEALVYLLFGRGSDWFLAHMLSGPPDFDQILSVEVDAADPPDGVPAQYLTLPGRVNGVADRLRPGDVLSCAGGDIEVRIVGEPYCEVGELTHTVGNASGMGFGQPDDCPAG